MVSLESSAIIVGSLAVVVFLSLVVVWFIVRRKSTKIRQELESEKKLIHEERRNSEVESRELVQQARDELQKMRKQLEREKQDRREELRRAERQLDQHQKQLNDRVNSIEQRDKDLGEKEEKLLQDLKEVESQADKFREELTRISGISNKEAEELLLAAVEKELQSEIGRRVTNAEEEAKRESDDRARKVITLAIERCAVDHVSQSTVTTLPIPSDDLKGRIIGKEGRNIRAFETLTGVDLVVDDTPEHVVISSFDPVRRRIASTSLKALVADGRIHPARIEDVVEKARQDVESDMLKEAKQAIQEAGCEDVSPGLLRLIARLAYRTSIGQNVLWHSVECAILCGSMASELGANERVARRGAFFHDIGKGVDHQMDGTHTQIGIDILRRYGESEEVIHTVAAHHEDIPKESIEAVLVMVADAISAARPGARKDGYENYIKRLRALEEVAHSFDGVDRAYVIQAGREIRVIVKPQEIDDLMSSKLAREIAQGVERECDYPGQIKVTVIREKRDVEYAR